MSKSTFTFTNTKTGKVTTKEIPNVILGSVSGLILGFAFIGAKEFVKSVSYSKKRKDIEVIHF